MSWDDTACGAMQRAIGVLLAVSLLTAAYTQAAHHAYTDAAPKKLYLLHFHEQEHGSDLVVHDELHLLGTDPVPVEDAISNLVLRPGLPSKALQVGASTAAKARLCADKHLLVL